MKRSFTGWSARLGRVARWVGGLSIGTMAALTVIFPTAGEARELLSPLVLAGAIGMVAAPTLWAGGWLVRLLGRWRDGAVRADAGALEVSEPSGAKVRRFEPAAMVSGLVVPLEGQEGEEAELRVLLKNGDQLRLQMDSVAEADELLRALELGPGQRRLVFRWARIFDRIIAAIGAFLATSLPLMFIATALKGTALHAAVGFLWIVLPFFAAGWAARQLRREVVAGTDGVEARIGRKRFAFRFADVEEMRVEPRDVVFVVDGGELRIPLDMDERSQGHALAHRFELAWEHFQQSVGSGGAQRFLRGELSFQAWKDKLRALLKGAATMREAPLRVEDARRVLGDPEADPEARAGAALALAAAGDEADRQRVRVTIEGTTRPKVRVVLDAALEGELEEAQLEAARAEHAVD